MGLSDHEQSVLEQMERAMTSEDPRFATFLSGLPHAVRAPQNVTAAIVAVLLGAAAMIAGVAAAAPAVGIVGFLVVVGGISAVVTTLNRRQSKPKVVRPGFMDGLGQRWDNR